MSEVNGGLEVLCNEEQINYVDNSNIFFLQDRSLNDGYFITDGIHFTWKAATRLARNMKLILAEGVQHACKISKKKRQPNRETKQQTLARNLSTAQKNEGQEDRPSIKTTHVNRPTPVMQRSVRLCNNKGDTHRPINRLIIMYPNTVTTGETDHVRNRCKYSKVLICNICSNSVTSQSANASHT